MDNLTRNRMQKLYVETPVWKILLRLSVPTVFMMLVFGAYTYFDSILSVLFAPDFYKNKDDIVAIVEADPNLDYADIVRRMMSATQPIIGVTAAVTFLFAAGISTRVTLNMGRGDVDRAIMTIRTGTMVAIFQSVILSPILLLIARPWMTSLFDETIAEYAFNYVFIIVIASPLFIFNNILSRLFRNEGKNKVILVANILPTFLNLLLDWVFMKVLGMGIEGGAMATVISYVFTFMIQVSWMLFIKSDLLKFSVLFGFKIKFVTLFGILLVGLSPFLRNMGNSITSSLKLSTLAEISEHIYGAAFSGRLQDVETGYRPTFILIFAATFGLVQAAVPIASYNYGYKTMNRVKQTYYWLIVYSFILSAIFFIVFGIILVKPLLELSQVHENNYILTRNNLWIYTGTLPLFSFSLGGIALFSATDRIYRMIFTSILFSIVVYIPVLYIFRFIALNNTWPYTISLAQPVTLVISSLISHLLAIGTLNNLDKNPRSIDDMINEFHKKHSKKHRA